MKKRSLRNTSEIVELLSEVANSLSEVANSSLNNEVAIKKADIALRTAKHAIQVYSLLLESAQMRKEASRKLRPLELA